LSRASTLKNE
jgi:hypothetical protein